MKFQVVRNTALTLLERFKTQGSLDPNCRQSLIEPAAQSEKRRLSADLVTQQAEDSRPEHDLLAGKGEVETRRGPDPKESIERSLYRRARYDQQQMLVFQEATLAKESEPYQETVEFTRFRGDGIEHVSLTILGDAVGVGGIHGMAEFLSNEPEKSWRERTYQDFHQSDLIAIYQQGTYSSPTRV